jgi:hypothetical protein
MRIAGEQRVRAHTQTEEGMEYRVPDGYDTRKVPGRVEKMNEDTIEERFTLEIEPDPDPENPWEMSDHASKIVHWHRRGFFGESIIGREQEWIEQTKKEKETVFLPLYLYEHGGQTISLGGFSDPWDSGCVGFVWTTKKKVESLMGPTRYWRKTARKIIAQEIKELDQYLTGDVWGYMVKDKDGEIVDSCWGFFGRDFVEEEGNRAFAYHVKKHAQFLLPIGKEG